LIEVFKDEETFLERDDFSDFFFVFDNKLFFTHFYPAFFKLLALFYTLFTFKTTPHFFNFKF